MLENSFSVRKLHLGIAQVGARFLLLAALGGASCVCAGEMQNAGGELHYSGGEKGVAIFNGQKVHCMSRSGQIVSMTYKMDMGKSPGPNITFFVADGNTREQHLGFVPTGQSQQSDFFSAHAVLIPGLGVTSSNGSWTLVFHGVRVQQPLQPGVMLILNGSVQCSATNALNL